MTAIIREIILEILVLVMHFVTHDVKRVYLAKLSMLISVTVPEL